MPLKFWSFGKPRIHVPVDKPDKVKLQEAMSVFERDHFYKLTRDLTTKTSHMSMIRENIPEFQELLSMGKSIIPLLLEDLYTYEAGGDEDPFRFSAWYHIRLLHKTST